VAARIGFARQLASQAAMALFNAFTIAQNRVLAYYDALTSLPNRLLFKERTEQALVVAKRRGDRLAVCVLDLDDFKRVNDTLGHDAGDRLLKEVATRISGVLRSGTLARLGGDEFTILVREMESIEDPARVATKVLDELARPFGLPGREVFITGSIGIAVHPVDGDDLDTLMRNADAAMYHAKDDGGGAYHFYTPSMHATALERLTLEGDLRHALERGELRLEYQPVVETSSRELIGAEAMLRWQHPVRGVIYPDDFISLAEDSGLIVPIGAWALRTACAQSRKWQLAGLRPLRISVNLSSRQLRDAALVETVRGALSDSGLYAEHLALELTESMLMDASEETLRCFREVKQMGVQLSLDDFGVGYSSLSYLRQFPLDYVKIDRSFIDEVSGNSEDAAIVRAILAMAHSLKLRVVAEGVEREDQFAFLREHGCDAVQGFLFSEPLPPDAFTKLLAGLDPR
jgi:diguanylate cyclase (GGDEF)-like protein